MVGKQYMIFQVNPHAEGMRGDLKFENRLPLAASNIVVSYFVDSLRAKFCRGNKNVYLHFMSLLRIDVTQVLQILPLVRPGPTYST